MSAPHEVKPSDIPGYDPLTNPLPGAGLGPDPFRIPDFPATLPVPTREISKGIYSTLKTQLKAMVAKPKTHSPKHTKHPVIKGGVVVGTLAAIGAGIFVLGGGVETQPSTVTPKKGITTEAPARPGPGPSPDQPNRNPSRSDPVTLLETQPGLPLELAQQFCGIPDPEHPNKIAPVDDGSAQHPYLDQNSGELPDTNTIIMAGVVNGVSMPPKTCNFPPGAAITFISKVGTMGPKNSDGQYADRFTQDPYGSNVPRLSRNTKAVTIVITNKLEMESYYRGEGDQRQREIA